MIKETIILASSSPRRKEILEQMGFNIKVVYPDFDEDDFIKKNQLKPVKLALNISKLKAKSVSDKYPHNIIIAADTIVVIKNKMLGKPSNLDEAKYFLSLIKNKKHDVITAYTILYKYKSISNYIKTKVFVKDLTEKEIENYLQEEYVLDAAGGYKIQGKFALFVKYIKGCWFNVIGFPISQIYDDLKKILY